MTEADLAIYHELRGTTCACGATKKARQSFCRTHYFSLPKGTQRELYEVDGYPETYRRACGLLGLLEPAVRATIETISAVETTDSPASESLKQELLLAPLKSFQNLNPIRNMKKPQKKTTAATLVLLSDEAMVGTLNQYVTTSLDLARRKAEHEAAVAALQAKFDEDPWVIQLRAEMAMLESSVALYALNNRGTLFPEEKKSREYQNATIGFRDDPPSVGKALKDDTLEAICERLTETDWGGQYVDWKASLQKAALLRDRANLKEEQLRTVGLKFEQGEKFFITPKSEVAERAATPVREVAA